MPRSLQNKAYSPEAECMSWVAVINKSLTALKHNLTSASSKKEACWEEGNLIKGAS